MDLAARCALLLSGFALLAALDLDAIDPGYYVETSSPSDVIDYKDPCKAVAYLGDIALDEEDMRMFKVDRIVNLAERTVTVLNHTDAGLIGSQRLRKRT
ncbi:tolloid-like protein 1 [Sinocyclocheilus grahami]|uniref:tolloid-like protein 1 n=1 Tax=Sinocyclocheilus grahami TaxID=75366 RepID=UPI0007ACA777|nr:PREDICTED: tolloid-like protein 1 [Sinocyclocheilus grahami]